MVEALGWGELCGSHELERRKRGFHRGWLVTGRRTRPSKTYFALQAILAVWLSFAPHPCFAQVASSSCSNPELDKLVQEYKTVQAAYIPKCNEFTNSAHSPHLSFQALNTGDYLWAILRGQMLEGSECIYKHLSASEHLLVNSGYRNPFHNAKIPNSAPESRHIYGDAVDIQTGTTTWDEYKGSRRHVAHVWNRSRCRGRDTCTPIFAGSAGASWLRRRSPILLTLASPCLICGMSCNAKSRDLKPHRPFSLASGLRPTGDSGRRHCRLSVTIPKSRIKPKFKKATRNAAGSRKPTGRSGAGEIRR